MKRRILVSAVLALGLSGVSAWASASKNTNITVDTAESGLISLNEKTKAKDERLKFYDDDSTTVGFNEEGDPAVGMRF